MMISRKGVFEFLKLERTHPEELQELKLIFLEFLREVLQKADDNLGQIYRGERISIELRLQ